MTPAAGKDDMPTNHENQPVGQIAAPRNGVRIGATSAAESWPWRSRIGLIGLLLVTGIAYGPVLTNGFTNWDDDVYVWNNPHMTAPDGLARIWLTLESPQYYPLTFTVFWAQYRIWGERAGGYHAVNLVLHLVNVILVFTFLRRIGLVARAALIGAALFALHPVQVGSVAWTVELKNVLSTLLYLSAVLAYLRWRRQGTWLSYAGSLVLFVGALLSKTNVLTLPASVLVLEVLVLGRRPARSLIRVIPFGLLSALAAAVTILAERAGAADLPGFGSRMLIACAAPWFYLYKLIWPLAQPAVYPRWHVSGTWWPGWMCLLGACIVIALLTAFRKRINAQALWGLCHFALSLGPVLGLVPFGYLEKSYVADHFLYLPLIGLAAAVGIGLNGLADRFARSTGVRYACAGLATVLFVALATKTWMQAGIWRDSETLWTHTLRLNPTCSTADNNLGIVRMQRGDLKAAHDHFARALRNNPAGATAYNNLGSVLFKRGRFEEAIQHFRQAIQRRPGYADAHLNLALALVEVRRLPETRLAFEKVLELEPYRAEAHHGLGRILAIERRWTEAVAAYRKALSRRRDYPDALANLGSALIQLGKHDEARRMLNRALAIKPTYAPAHSSLAFGAEAQNDFDRAEHHYRKAVELAPSEPQNHYNLGNFYAKRGKLPQAVSEYHRALAIAPGYVDAHINLGNALRALGQVDAAIRQYQEALEHASDNVTLLYNLAMTLSEVGQYGRAIRIFREGLERFPRRPELAHGLAWTLATCPQAAHRDGPTALKLARQLAASVQQPRPDLLDLLAAATAETGDYAGAARLADQAAQLAGRIGNAALAGQIRQRAQRYRAGKPYRQPSSAPGRPGATPSKEKLTPANQSP